MTAPTSPIAAVTAVDPYPFYRELVARRPFYRDEAAAAWVASSADAVRAVLDHPALGVRPAAEPVPAGLVGTAPGAVFGRLARMTDGPGQRMAKAAVTSALATVDPRRAASIAYRRTVEVLAEGGPHILTRLQFEVPVGVVGELCGVSPAAQIAEPTRNFVACIPASATPADQAGAAAATVTLSALLEPLLQPRAETLLGALTRAARESGACDAATVAANAIGLLSQTYDATAGLIGIALLARAGDTRGDAGPGTADADYVLEVARHDAPIQNTRRFAHADAEVLGHQVRAGQAVIVVLAAANRDPTANPDPDVFDPARRDPALFTFGLGRHACPGTVPAAVIAASVLRAVEVHGLNGAVLPTTVRYRALSNARIPDL